jgi:beta-lactamase regulating signal transducer with metallopeptidase domain
MPTISWPQTRRFLIIAWIVGTVVWCSIQFYLCLRFRFALRSCQPSAELRNQVEILARRIGLVRWPDVLLMDEEISPMLWGMGPNAVIVLPRRLIAHMNMDRLSTLLAHEMAHFRRGDQWVRCVELLATGLYWWHPAVWWARRELELAEEQCCDAWVVDQCLGNSRPYAEAILETLDFLSNVRPRAIRNVACGMGYGLQLRYRLRDIMKGGVPKDVSIRGRAICAAIAAVGLPLHPTFSLSHQQTPRLNSRSHVAAFAIKSEPAHRRIKRTPEIVGIPSVEYTDSEWATASSRDGRFQISARPGYRTRLLDTTANRSIEIESGRITCAAFFPNGNTFATGDASGRLLVWDASSGASGESVPQDIGSILSVDVSPDGALIVAAGESGIRQLCHSNAHLATKRIGDSVSPPVRCVRFSPNGRQVAVARDTWRTSQDGIVELWNIEIGTLEATWHFPRSIGAVEFQNEYTLLVADWSGNVVVWSLQEGRSLAQIAIDKDLVSASSFSANTHALTGAALMIHGTDLDRQL